MATKKSSTVAKQSDAHDENQRTLEEQHQRRLDDLEFRRGLDASLGQLKH